MTRSLAVLAAALVTGCGPNYAPVCRVELDWNFRAVVSENRNVRSCRTIVSGNGDTLTIVRVRPAGEK